MRRIDAIFLFFLRQLFLKIYLFIYFVKDMFIILFSTQSGISFAKHLCLQTSGNIFWILCNQIDSIFLFFIYQYFSKGMVVIFLSVYSTCNQGSVLLKA